MVYTTYTHITKPKLKEDLSNMRNETIRRMTLDAMFIALMIVFYFLNFGFVRIFPIVSITILHVFVIIVALFGGYKRALVQGLAFGTISLLQALIAPFTVADEIFRNPLISILPRVLFAIFAGLLASSLIKRFENNPLHLSIYSGVVAAISTLFHTLVTVGCIFIFAAYGDINAYFTIIGTLLASNGLFEIILAVIVVPAVVVPLYKYSRRFYV